jgi:threonine dehydrogenase-like Zn-dependent dehydrogenase
MWAEALTAPGHFDHVEVPRLTDDQVPDGHLLLKGLAGGVCGSDLPYFRGGVFPHPKDRGGSIGHIPGFPMHEVVGEVVVSKSPDHRVGDRVVGWAIAFDAISEYVLTAADQVAAYDPEWAPAKAIAAQPLACVIYAVEQMNDVRGKRVTVFGQGPIGLLFSHVLHDRGATVTGVDRVDRTDVAKLFGVTTTVTSQIDRYAAALGDEERPQLVVDAIGHQVNSFRHAVDAVAFGGEIFYFGVPDDAVYPLEMQTFFRKNLTLRAGYTFDRVRVLNDAIDYLRRCPDLLEQYVTTVLPATRVQEAFEAAARPQPGQFKVVIDLDLS